MAAATVAPPGAGDIFGRLVEHENDVAGYVAYALYKQDKRAFIESRQNASDSDIGAFCHSVLLPNHLANYRDRALSILGAMQEELYGEQAKELEADFNRRIASHVSRLPRHRPVVEWFKHIFQHIVGSLLATFLAVMILLAALGWKQGVANMLQQIFEVEVKTKAPAANDAPGR